MTKPLHEMTEAELIAEVSTWDVNEFMNYVKEVHPEILLDFEDDA